MKKIYGQSRIEKCPFCSKAALTKNKQGIPVCNSHKERLLELKCACGSTLEVKEGKWGSYLSCLRCGNINIRKALEMSRPGKNEAVITRHEKEGYITSEDVDLYYS